MNFDPEDAEYYSSIGGEIGEKLRRHLAVDKDGDNIFTLTKDKRCPFLNNKNLCELYIALGKESLCPTCTLFPRFYDDFGSFREMGLGFGCPEAARIILSQNSSIKIAEFADIEAEETDIDDDLFDLMFEERDKILFFLGKKLPIKNTIKALLEEAKRFQSEIFGMDDTESKSKYTDLIELMAQMEYIDGDREKLYTTLPKSFSFDEFEDDFRRLLEYYIFRYMFKAVYDRDLLTKIKYGVFACAVIGRAYAKKNVLTLEDRIDIMCGYSKEVEYSDVNMNLLDNVMRDSFSVDSLVELIQ